jgi:hypothetical protein
MKGPLHVILQCRLNARGAFVGERLSHDGRRTPYYAPMPPMSDEALVVRMFEELSARFPPQETAVRQQSAGLFELTRDGHGLSIELLGTGRLARIVMHFQNAGNQRDRVDTFSLMRPSSERDSVVFASHPEQTISEAADIIYRTFETLAAAT